MVGESNQNVFLIQIDASSFAEFEISEFEISRVECNIADVFYFISEDSAVSESDVSASQPANMHYMIP